MNTGYRVEIDIRSSDLRMGQVVETIRNLSLEDPDREFFMDGDLYAIVSKPRKASGEPSAR